VKQHNLFQAEDDMSQHSLHETYLKLHQ